MNPKTLKAKNGSASRRMATLGAFLLMPLLAGCSDGLATVTGQVTLNGVPLAGSDDVRGTVYYFPEGGTGAPAAGLIDGEGRYELGTGSKVGVNPGPYLVTISAIESVPSTIEGAAPGGKPLTPRRYADPSKSGFRVEVEPGSNEFDFSLEGEIETRRRRRR